MARFEPPDCVKGDVARIWLYMHEIHKVQIPTEEHAMFLIWAASDPVSPWELKRDGLIANVQGNSNPYISGTVPSIDGSCPWEK